MSLIFLSSFHLNRPASSRDCFLNVAEKPAVRVHAQIVRPVVS